MKSWRNRPDLIPARPQVPQPLEWNVNEAPKPPIPTESVELMRKFYREIISKLEEKIDQLETEIQRLKNA